MVYFWLKAFGSSNLTASQTTCNGPLRLDARFSNPEKGIGLLLLGLIVKGEIWNRFLRYVRNGSTSDPELNRNQLESDRTAEMWQRGCKASWLPGLLLERLFWVLSSVTQLASSVLRLVRCDYVNFGIALRFPNACWDSQFAMHSY